MYQTGLKKAGGGSYSAEIFQYKGIGRREEVKESFQNYIMGVVKSLV